MPGKLPYGDLLVEVKQLRKETKAQADEIADLKRRLAARDPIEAAGLPIKRTGKTNPSGDDWMGSLAAQDRQFFERKLGTKQREK